MALITYKIVNDEGGKVKKAARPRRSTWTCSASLHAGKRSPTNRALVALVLDAVYLDIPHVGRLMALARS